MCTSLCTGSCRGQDTSTPRPRFLFSLVGALWASFLLPSEVAPQLRSELDLSPLGAFAGVCANTASLQEGIWPTVFGAMESRDREAWRPRLRRLEDSMAVAAGLAPSDVGTQYLYAVVMGARTDVESGSTQVRKAKELHGQVERVLAMEPDHPGAHYLMGRLNAAVMRLGRVKRFIATKLLGGGALSSASWGEAQRFLEIAAERDPCVPDHHLELALVYAETKQHERSKEELDLLFLVVSDDSRGERMARRGRRLLNKLEKSERGKK